MVLVFGLETSMSYWNVIKLLGTVLLTSATWITVTLLTSPVEDGTLRSFYSRIRPGGPGWQAVVDRAERDGVTLLKEDNLKWDVPTGILCMMLGTTMIYSLLFMTGNLLYANWGTALILGSLAAGSGFLLTRFWDKLRMG